MNRLLTAVGVVLLLALDWAALHDILKANEPDYTAEYATLAASAMIFAALAARWSRTRRRASAA